MITNLKCKNTINSIHFQTTDNITYTKATQNYPKPLKGILITLVSDSEL